MLMILNKHSNKRHTFYKGHHYIDYVMKVNINFKFRRIVLSYLVSRYTTQLLGYRVILKAMDGAMKYLYRLQKRSSTYYFKIATMSLRKQRSMTITFRE